MIRYIYENKAEYYLLLQAIRESDDEPDKSIAWQNWILYILNAVSKTAQTTLAFVIGIRDQMAALITGICDGELTKMYRSGSRQCKTCSFANGAGGFK